MPFLYVGFDEPEVGGVAHPSTQVDVRLRTSGGTLRGSFSDFGSPDGGSFRGSFRNSAGADVNAAATNKVVASFASDATLNVIDPNLAGNFATNDVTGKCYPNQPFFLLAEEPQITERTPYFTEFAGIANSAGNFTVNVATQGSQAGFDLMDGDMLYVECRTKKGDLLWGVDEV